VAGILAAQGVRAMLGGQGNALNNRATLRPRIELRKHDRGAASGFSARSALDGLCDNTCESKKLAIIGQQCRIECYRRTSNNGIREPWVSAPA
jgi:hypothetical protein